VVPRRDPPGGSRSSSWHRFTSPACRSTSPGGHADVPPPTTDAGGDNAGLPGYEPANTAYGFKLAAWPGRGRLLADRGALGRFCVDSAAARTGSGRWQVYGLEINLRKSGTTHLYPCSATSSPAADNGSGAGLPRTVRRFYRATDNLVDPAWHGRPADEVIGGPVRRSRLRPADATGGAAHVLRTGHTPASHRRHLPEHADELYEAAVIALSSVRCPPGCRPRPDPDPGLTRPRLTRPG
jgi:hypothetical protein